MSLTLLGFDTLLEWLTEFKETLKFTSLLHNKLYDKGYRWTARPSHIGWSLEESRGQELLSPCIWEHHPPGTWMSSPTWKLSRLLNISIFNGGFITWARLISVSSSLPLPEDEVGTESSKFLIMAWSFWWPALIWSYWRSYQELPH